LIIDFHASLMPMPLLSFYFSRFLIFDVFADDISSMPFSLRQLPPLPLRFSLRYAFAFTMRCHYFDTPLR